MLPQTIRPDWPAPKQISAFSTTRNGGISKAPYDSFNLAGHVGDAEADVAANRRCLAEQLQLPSPPLWLSQQHTCQVIHYNDQSRLQKQSLVADACYTRQLNRVCVIMTADCLPILLCNKQGQWVAAVHAGWRGLAAGILQKTLSQYAGNTAELMAWVGPAIGKNHFEVGAEVRQQFIKQDPDWMQYFESQDQSHYNCDLIGICKHILTRLKVATYGGHWCSYADEAFYSYRRDGNTGRMASLIWINNE